jgi:spore coat protein H
MRSRSIVPALVAIALAAVGCGGGGTSPGDGALASWEGDIVDAPGAYSDPGTDLVTLYVEIWPADNPEEGEDTDCGFVDPNDGLGTTLDDVNRDLSDDDDCQPEVNIRLELDGVPAAGGVANAEMRLRGQSTRFAAQKSYRIKLKSKAGTDLWRGQRVLNLNKHPYDLTRLRNKLSFDLLATIPHIPSLRTQFVRMFIDQRDGRGMVDYGLFTHVEKVDGYFLESHGLDPDASVYKAEFFEFERYPDNLKLETDPGFNKDAFEQILEIEEGDDHTVLLEMLDAVNDESLDFADVFATHFNENNYLTWLACNILLDNVDTNSQNFFLYRPAASKVFYFMPWDYDGAFDFYGQPDQAQRETLGRWQRGISNWWASTLHARYLRQPGAVARLTARMEAIKDVYLTAPRIQALVDSYETLVRTRIALPPDLDHLPVFDGSSPAAKLAEFDAEVARLPALIEDHYQNFLATLERPMPVFMSATVIGSEVEFRWSASYDLQGDGLRYDFQLSTSPAFAPGEIVTESLGLVDTLVLRVPLASLAPGEYFYRVLIRDDRNPAENWQTAFDSYWDEGADVTYFGMRRLVIE